MHLKSKIIILLSVLYFLSCNLTNQNAGDKNQSNTNDTALGVLELYDKNASNIIDANAKIEVIGKGYNWSEGPVWIESM